MILDGIQSQMTQLIKPKKKKKKKQNSGGENLPQCVRKRRGRVFE